MFKCRSQVLKGFDATKSRYCSPVKTYYHTNENTIFLCKCLYFRPEMDTWTLVYLFFCNLSINVAYYLLSVLTVLYSNSSNYICACEHALKTCPFLKPITRNISCLQSLVPEGIIRPVVSVSALTWFIRYIYYWNLQFLKM